MTIYAVTSGMTLPARTVKATDSFFAHFKLMRESGMSHQLGWPPQSDQSESVHVSKLSTDFLVRVLQFSRDCFAGVRGLDCKKTGSKNSSTTIRVCVLNSGVGYFSYWEHAAWLGPDTAAQDRQAWFQRAERVLLSKGCLPTTLLR